MHGQRNRAVFRYARELKGIADLAGRDPMTLKPLVREFHQAALPYIGTKPFEETWIDFLKGWERVKFPANKEYVAMILERAKADPVAGFEEPKIGLLAAVCRELAAEHPDSIFYLAVRKGAELLDADPRTIGKWLFLLEAERVIRTVQKGGTSETPRQATRFRYTGPGKKTDENQ